MKMMKTQNTRLGLFATLALGLWGCMGADPTWEHSGTHLASVPLSPHDELGAPRSWNVTFGSDGVVYLDRYGADYAGGQTRMGGIAISHDPFERTIALETSLIDPAGWLEQGRLVVGEDGTVLEDQLPPTQETVDLLAQMAEDIPVDAGTAAGITGDCWVLGSAAFGTCGLAGAFMVACVSGLFVPPLIGSCVPLSNPDTWGLAAMCGLSGAMWWTECAPSSNTARPW